MKLNNFLKFVISVAICELPGIIGAVFTAPSISSGWYQMLVKPSLNPPSWVFGPVWTALYFLMGVSLYIVWKNNWRVRNPLFEKTGKPWNRLSEKFWSGSWQKANIIGIFAIQLALNIKWSIIFFGSTSLTINGLNNIGIAFVEIIFLWFAILYTIINFYRVSRASAYLLIPYILWVTFAGYLNFSLWVLN